MTLKESRGDIGEAKERANDHPPEKMKRKAYERELQKLQVRLCKLQDWVKAKGLRVVIAFEGRDAAGKGGTIKVPIKSVHAFFALTRSRPLPIAKNLRCIYSATSNGFRPPERS